MKEVKANINKIMTIPSNTETAFPHVVSWLFSMFMLFSFLYVCEITGI